MSTVVRPLLQVIVDEALSATGARCGQLTVVDGDVLRIVAVAGTARTSSVGSVVAITGARGYALSADQPAALQPDPGDESNRGTGGFDGVPPSLLVAAGGDGAALLEVAAKQVGGGFTFDDIEAVSSLAAIAAAALAEGEVAPNATSPARLAAELSALADADGRRYQEVAQLIETLLGHMR